MYVVTRHPSNQLSGAVMYLTAAGQWVWDKARAVKLARREAFARAFSLSEDNLLGASRGLVDVALA